MIRLNQIKISNNGMKGNEFCHIDNIKKELKSKASKLLRINVCDIEDIKIVRHSIDARKKPDIFDVYVCDIKLSKGNEASVIKKSGNKNAEIVTKKSYVFPDAGDIKLDRRPIIVGSGPAGLFCAYELAVHGYKPIIIERGSSVDIRKQKVDEFWNSGKLDINSNVQFGEGGAGTFSDGKLNTVVKDRDGRGTEILETFVKYGAKENILFENKPHIGTDILTCVIKNMRDEIIKLGGEYHFDTTVTDFIIEDGKICGVDTTEGKFESEVVVLAIGHSARDTFIKLKERKIDMKPKAFAVGFRVEHKQSLINHSQYGIESPTSLPASPYKVVMNSSFGRGVYSFCMCPGGYVVNASSEEGRTCVNGMSYNARDGLNANSAIIVSVSPEDFESDDVLSGMYFQRKLEEKAYKAGNGKVPVQFYGDFRNKITGETKEEEINNLKNIPQIKGEYVFTDLTNIMPDYINKAFVEGMDRFGQMIKGFDAQDTLIDGVETRTSSPVRINRDENMDSVSVKGLYPCGEGAGYAGGIMSAAMDGIKVAEKIAGKYYAK
ncbi:MAG: FAD-binding protein [Butyrivibrio sp.]|nr:FAD-binding protein [Butyrivibrio sp.]